MAYFKRDIEQELLKWKNDNERYPLLIRGARQVGKSTMVRHFGSNFRNLIEVNFEQSKEAKTVFEGSLNPQRICEQLSILFDKPIVAGETLLFLRDRMPEDYGL